MEIKTTHRKELDINWWNAFVEESANPLVFSLSYNLDVFYNKNWIIICVLDNKKYLGAVALPFRRIYGLNLSIQHEFHRYNNILFNGLEKISERKKYQIYNLIFKEIYLKFYFFQFYVPPIFKEAELLSSNKFNVKVKQTNILDINQYNFDYINSIKIKKLYNRLKSIDYRIEWKSIDILSLENLFKNLSLESKYVISKKNKKQFFEFIEINIDKNSGNCFSMFDKKNGECIIFCFFLCYNKMAFSHHILINPDYAETSPGSLFIKEIFNKYKEEDFSQLDFLGSMLPQVNTFNKNFNTKSEMYISVEKNMKIFRSLIYLKSLLRR